MVKKLKVLIIEDEPMLRDAYRHVLRFKGYKVAVAADGEEGLQLLDRHKPDIVLLDVLMPKLDGIDFLRQAGIKERYPKTKVLACTNLSDHKTREQMAEAGADKQVLKSDLSPTELVQLIEQLANA